MSTQEAFDIVEAYRWQRRLGNSCIATSHCHIVADAARPDVWDANHADEVVAETEAEMNAVFAAMDVHLAHTPWRVVHTDGFTPDAFLARLAFENFEERPVTIQMALRGELVTPSATLDLRPVVGEPDWDMLLKLVLVDHAEGRRTGGLDISPEISAAIVENYRAKSEHYHFELAMRNENPIAFGAYAAAPNGVGMIEDLFTLPTARRAGLASAMIGAFVGRLRAEGCRTIFIGALAEETAKRLYARLGFQPVGLARAWVRKIDG